MSICGWVRGVVTFFYPAQLADAMRQQDYADREAEEEVHEVADRHRQHADSRWPDGPYFTCKCGHQAQQHPIDDSLGGDWRACSVCDCASFARLVSPTGNPPPCR